MCIDEKFDTAMEYPQLAVAWASIAAPCFSQTPVKSKKYLFPAMNPENEENTATTNPPESTTVGTSV